MILCFSCLFRLWLGVVAIYKLVFLWFLKVQSFVFEMILFLVFKQHFALGRVLANWKRSDAVCEGKVLWLNKPSLKS